MKNNPLSALNRGLDLFVYWMTALTAGLFFVIIVVSVVSGLLDYPIQSKEELSGLFFVWSCFAGAAMCYRRGEHIKLVFLYERFSARGKWVLSLLCDALIFLFLLIVFVKSIEMIILLNKATMPMSQISEVWLYMPVPLFSLVMMMYTLEFMWLHGKPQPEGGEEPC